MSQSELPLPISINRAQISTWVCCPIPVGCGYFYSCRSIGNINSWCVCHSARWTMDGQITQQFPSALPTWLCGPTGFMRWLVNHANIHSTSHNEKTKGPTLLALLPWNPTEHRWAGVGRSTFPPSLPPLNLFRSESAAVCSHICIFL